MTAENTADAAAPDTIVLVHGFWVTPRSWEKWVEHYEGQGYRVLTPAYPGFEVEVEALQRGPLPIEALTFPAIIEHIGSIIDELDKPPIIIGHSAGGVLTQILLDHGYGAAGVAIDSVPPEGVKVVPSRRSGLSSLSLVTPPAATRPWALLKSSGTTPSPTT